MDVTKVDVNKNLLLLPKDGFSFSLLGSQEIILFSLPLSKEKVQNNDETSLCSTDKKQEA